MKYLFLLMLLVVARSFAQPAGFQKFLRDAEPVAVMGAAQTHDGGTFAVGFVTGMLANSRNRGYFVRFDLSGNVKWSGCISDTSMISLNSAVETSTGDFIAVGTSMFAGVSNYKANISKIDASGKLVWHRTIMGYWGLQTTEHDGGYVFVGSVSDATGRGMFILKTDTAGNTLWSRSYAINRDEINFRSIITTNDGGLLLTGTLGIRSETDMLLVKTDASGAIDWIKTYDSPVQSADVPGSAIQLANGNFMISGRSSTISGPSGSGITNFFLLETSTTGDVKWAKRYEISSQDVANRLIACADGGFAIVGSMAQISQISKDAVIIRTNDTGGVKWTKLYGRAYVNDDFIGGHQTADGGFMLVGNSVAPDSGNREGGYFVRTDAYGTVGCYSSDTVISTYPVSMNVKKPTWNMRTDAPQNIRRSMTMSQFGRMQVLCQAVGVATATIPATMVISPNPAQTRISVAASGLQLESLTLTNLSGAIAYTRQCSGDSTTADISMLPSGIYFYSIRTTTRQLIRGKLFVAH